MKDPDFQLVGIIRRDPVAKKLILDTDHPECYWEEVDTEEDLKNAPHSWGGCDYAMVK